MRAILKRLLFVIFQETVVRGCDEMAKVSDDVLLEAIENNANISRLCDDLGITRTWFYKRINSEDFIKKRRKIENQQYRFILSKLQELAGKSLNSLEKILDDSQTSANAKIRASIAVLQLCDTYRQNVDFSERLQSLEDLQNETK